MSRKAGKAANRKSRQRKAQRATPPPPPAAASPLAAAHGDVAESVAAMPASRPVTPAPAPAKPRQAGPRSAVPATGSQLTAGERSEYHYVERDLRDIGILTSIMALLLLAAWIAFRALGVLG